LIEPEGDQEKECVLIEADTVLLTSINPELYQNCS
jgi:hypothetical protein